ncbi:hypothetical protein KM914_11600 [Virgibacillus pantothenticus]|uniref:hypothetical protein n=1 Tax=Virgibacillus pantothenticus TaxID=1473 RepID=UPI001C23C156|nr:hypothetical protein [Virgibacillus pantothenticus]MBU8567071.1 hypothetical protein [Virgibacillus pantothenticus]MBU8600897.1 hypothetical protein [Virgibacillus pantothenticus]MBU8635223.1 hypothetical protein [Virgibacillus pantothenticus]MBU8660781.1 hypothetical protein [Virgibacillus pantothenticus]MBU8664503.1 hypothetical protein [Virgibacillus pantothenticus]
MKYQMTGTKNVLLGVAPYIGAWIEIVLDCILVAWSIVAPYIGVWIEIITSL